MKEILNTELAMDYSIDQAILDQNFKIVILKFSLNTKIIAKKIKLTQPKLNKRSHQTVKFFVIDLCKVKEFNFMYEIKIFPH